MIRTPASQEEGWGRLQRCLWPGWGAPSAQMPLLVAPWLEVERSSRGRAVELTVTGS